MSAKQYGVRLPAWHVERIEEFAKDSGVSATWVAKELLMAAIEQASGKKPNTVPAHLQKFLDGCTRPPTEVKP
tara:strand:+ start:421 stop:639 length:219 start_codon:yes stop_codon:yes gene_type:complete